ncbi:MAG: histidine phosphatase family protein [Candidatus Eremiobacteraeota bacterium]|nr:histidine phosphatase family protein [Candidatus Eremiobacteraeota bacterium]
MKIYLIRHGESIYNKNGILQGHIDIPLSDKGREQAIKTADRLKHDIKKNELKVVAVYSSDLKRATQTAQKTIDILKDDGLDFPIHYRENLREILLGVWEGKTKNQLYSEKEKDGVSLFEKWIKNPESIVPEGAEAISNFYDRAIKALSEIIFAYKENVPDGKSAIIVFAHGGVLSMILNYIYGKDPANFVRFAFPNARGFVVEYEGETGEINESLRGNYRSNLINNIRGWWNV